MERLPLRLKLFFRWLHNKKINEINGVEGEESKPEDEWKTPSFLQQIKKKKTSILAPTLRLRYGTEMSYLQSSSVNHLPIVA